MPNIWDPFGLLGRGVDVAKFVASLASSGERLTLELLQRRLDAVAATPRTQILQGDAKPGCMTQSLNAKMTRLLDRALDQSTGGSQTELYHHLLDQLVADEACLLGALCHGAVSPLVNVRTRSWGTAPGRAVLENACLIGRTANVALPAMVPQYVGHLLSLGLFQTGPEDPALSIEYELLMAESMVLRAIKDATVGPLPARVEKLTLSLSGHGEAFWAATMEEVS